MAQQEKKSLEEIERDLINIQSTDITVPVKSTVDELLRHLRNFKELDGRFDEIRDEIIQPVKYELRKAGRVSNASLFVGVLGIGFAIFTVVYNTLVDRDQPILSRLDEVAECIRPTLKTPEDVSYTLAELSNDMRFLVAKELGLTSKYAPKESELKIKRYDSQVVSGNSEKKIELRPTNMFESEVNKSLVPLVNLEIRAEDQLLGKSGLLQFVSLSSPNSTASVGNHSVILSEGDSFRIYNGPELEVVKIFRKESRMLPAGHKEDALLLRVK